MMHKSSRSWNHVIQKIKAVFLELDCEYFEFLLQATITSAASYLFTNNIREKSDVTWQIIPFPQIMKQKSQNSTCRNFRRETAKYFVNH